MIFALAATAARRRHRRGKPRPPPQRRLHHGGRPRGARDLGLRLEGQRDPEPRPPGPRGDALPERVRHELHLHAEPRRHPDRGLLPQERGAGLQPVRRLAGDRGEAPAGRRLPHRHGRQVAPRERPDRLRPLGDPARPGRLPRPRALHGDRREDLRRPLRHRRDHRPRDRLHPRAPEGPAVLPDAPPQGAAPRVDARREAPSRVRGPDDPGAADAAGRLRDAHGRAAREPPAGGRRPDAARPEARAAAGAGREGARGLALHEADRGRPDRGREADDPHRRGPRPLEVPALHAGLPRLRAVDRRQRGPLPRLPEGERPRAGHDRRLHERPGLLPRRPRPLRQALHVRGEPADAAPRALAGGGATRLAGGGDGPQRGLRADLPRGRRGGGARLHAGPEPPAAPARRDAPRTGAPRSTTATTTTPGTTTRAPTTASGPRPTSSSTSGRRTSGSCSTCAPTPRSCATSTASRARRR